MLLRDVVDEFHDRYGLADARTAEDCRLSTLGEWRDEVDDLDPRLEHFCLGGLLLECRG